MCTTIGPRSWWVAVHTKDAFLIGRLYDPPTCCSVLANPHSHLAAIDGVYSFDARTGPTFHFIAPPTKQELAELVRQVSRRVMRMLKHRGLIRDGPQTQGDVVEQTALGACQQASLRRGRFERVDDSGQSQLQLFGEQLTGSKRKSSPTAADFAGFSLEASVAMSALNRSGRRLACWPESRCAGPHRSASKSADRPTLT